MRTTTVIVGAGHSGLAMSRRLAERGIDHVAIERGRVGNSWRTERWPELRLLTPNWQTRLPGHSYQGNDRDGYMRATEVADFLVEYAGKLGVPVETNTTVRALRSRGTTYEVITDNGTWRAPTVVIASGACNLPMIPNVAACIPPSIISLSPMAYQGATTLPDGGVLIVGASASGVQLARDIRRSGRPVTLSVSGHVRLPRLYRGRDIFWWMEAAGVLDERYDEIDDLTRARHLPSPQLVGTPERTTIDLNALSSIGVRIVGRIGRIVDGTAQFSGGLASACALADLKMERLLTAFDRWAHDRGADDFVDRPHRFERTRLEPRPLLSLDLKCGEITTVIWCTGYRPDYSWIDLPVIERSGRIRHDGGIVHDSPGVYLLGSPLLRRRRSSFISGSVPDTDELCDHLHAYLSRRSKRAAHLGWAAAAPL